MRFHRATRDFLLAASLLAAGPAQGQPAAVVPFSAVVSYSDSVHLPALAGGLVWHQISDTTIPGERVEEYVPVGESAASWSQIITVKTFPLSRDPRSIMDGTINLMRDICGRMSVVNVRPSQETGATVGPDVPLPVYDVSNTLAICRHPDLAKLRARTGNDRVTLMPYEVTWYKLIRAQAGNFLVQRAWHGETVDSTNILGSAAVLAEWKSWAMNVSLVRRVAIKRSD
jgi:hypothetical protein